MILDFTNVSQDVVMLVEDWIKFDSKVLSDWAIRALEMLNCTRTALALGGSYLAFLTLGCRNDKTSFRLALESRCWP